jgi:predicted ABC-type ATPase
MTPRLVVLAGPNGAGKSTFYEAYLAELDSIQRVAHRVAAGGHDVPLDKLHARYGRSLCNLRLAIHVLPRVLVYDNNNPEKPHRFLAEFRDGVCSRRGTNPTRPGWLEKIL